MLSKADMLVIVIGLFKEQSYHGTTIREIAKALDLRETTVTTFLGSKEDMLWDITVRIARLFLAQARSVPQHISTVEQFRLLIYRHMEVVVQERDAVIVFLREWMFLDTAHYKEIVTMRDAYEAYFRRVIDNGARQDIFHVPDVDVACSFVFSSLQWAQQWDTRIDTVAFSVLAQRYCTLLQQAFCLHKQDTHERV